MSEGVVTFQTAEGEECLSASGKNGPVLMMRAAPFGVTVSPQTTVEMTNFTFEPGEDGEITVVPTDPSREAVISSEGEILLRYRPPSGEDSGES